MRVGRRLLPWWVRLPAKVALQQLPVTYRQLAAAGLTRHGRMDDAAYGIEVFRRHLDRARPWLPPDFTVLELGPGDALSTAVIARALGAGRTILVDAGDHAVHDVAPYDRLLGVLPRAPGLPERFEDAGHVLRATNATYLTGGLASLRTLPDASVDLVFSHAVLEHVLRDELGPVLRELFRVQRPGTACSHAVDLRDHVDDGLQTLRLPAWLWESGPVRRSSAYTNRLRAAEVLRAFEEAGYVVVEQVRSTWDTLPLPRRRLHRDFRDLPDEELRVRTIDVVAVRPLREGTSA